MKTIKAAKRIMAQPVFRLVLCIGLAVGTAIGAATHNIGMWMPIGLAVGLGLGLMLDHKNPDEHKDDTNGKQ